MKKMRESVMVLGALAILMLVGCRKERESDRKSDTPVSAATLAGAYMDAGVKIREVLWDRESAGPNGRGFIVESAAEPILAPLENQTVEFLQQQFAINVYDYLSPGHPEIPTLGRLALEAHRWNQLGYSLDTSAMDRTDAAWTLSSTARGGGVLQCLEEAFGIPVGLILGTAQGYTRKALIKAAKKLAMRTLGYVGVAYAIYDFGNCMEYW